jgi:acetamidase/formamidase
MAHPFRIGPQHMHTTWSQSHAAALRVPSGATVRFACRDGGNNQIRPDNAAAGAVHAFDFAQTDPAFGPVHVEGAEPGDALRVEILDLAVGAYGWTAVFEGFGLLSDEFAGRHLKMWDLRDEALLGGGSSSSKSKSNSNSNTSAGAGADAGGAGRKKGRLRAVFDAEKGISVPVRPMLGVLGVAPAQAGVALPTVPPYALSGGNMDCRELGVGATLWLPVHVPGALFSCGDGHAAQGDGEVCGTAIECGMTTEAVVSIAAGRPVSSVHAETPAGRITFGFAADLNEAMGDALDAMVTWLTVLFEVSAAEALALASTCVDLRVTQVANMTWGVHALLPDGLLSGLS